MAVIVPVITTFDAKGINKAITQFKALDGGAAKTGFALRALDQGVTSLVTSLAKAGAAVAAVGGIIGFKLVSAAYESQKVMAQTQALITSTGMAAGVTALDVAALSERLSEQIGVDDELIQKSANLILTFKQVQNQAGENNNIFDRTVALAQDLGNVFGSADSAAMQLGKALSDPVKGLTALRKAGINFSESQKEQIKGFVESNNLLAAQKLILKEVESQVGGTAAATATDFDRMKVAVGNAAEALGMVLIPFVERLARIVIDNVVPYIKDFARVLGSEGLGGALGMLAGDFIGFITGLEGGGAKVYGFIAAMVALKAAVIGFQVATQIATVVNKAFNLSLAANPIGLVVAAIMALIVAVVAAYMKFEGFRKVVNAVINAVIGYLEFMVNMWIKAANFILAALDKLAAPLRKLGIDIPRLGQIGEVSFKRIGDAGEKAAKRIGYNFDRVVKTEAARWAGLAAMFKQTPTPDPYGGGGGGESATEKAKRQLKEYTDALNAVKDAQRGVVISTKAVADAQSNAAKAAIKVREAQADLVKATDAVADAESKLERIRRGVGKDAKESKDAADKVAEAQRSLEESGYALEDAHYKVKDAEQKLVDVRADATASARDIREAEMALARAKLDVQEQIYAQRMATESLTSAQIEYDEITNGASETSTRYKDALVLVNEAKDRQADAAAKVREAMDAERDAIEKITDAQEKARDATWELVDAQKALNEVASETPSNIIKKAKSEFAKREEAAAIAEIVTQPAAVVTRVTQPVVPDTVWSMPAGQAANVGTGPLGSMARRQFESELSPFYSPPAVNITNNITAGMGADSNEIATTVIDALRDYERVNGFVPIFTAVAV